MPENEPPPVDAEALAEVARRLREGGFVAAEDEAADLLLSAGGDEALLESRLRRRLEGEPLAWITGTTRFCGLELHVDAGVYVPRWQSEELARRAAALLPDDGVALDLCTGSGAVAAYLVSQRPGARVLASDVDEAAVACARRNGVDASRGDLFDAFPHDVRGCADVVVAVVPYVPTRHLAFLPRDTITFESTLAYDGGDQGTEVLRRVIAQSPRYLRSGGALLLELGGDQARLLDDDFARHQLVVRDHLVDDDGDLRGVVAVRAPSP